MIKKIYIPRLGANMESGIITSWYKKDGETVSKGEPIFEVVTEKATVEVAAPCSGILARILVSSGKEVPLGVPVGIIIEKEEERALIPSNLTADLDAGRGIVFSPAAKKLIQTSGINKDELINWLGSKKVVQVRDVEKYLKHLSRKEVPSLSTIRRVAIIGAGKYSKVVAEILTLQGYTIVGYFDDNLKGKDIIGPVKLLTEAISQIDGAIISIGNSGVRAKFFSFLQSLGVTIINAIHPRAVLSSSANIGFGVVVEAGSVIGPETIVEDGVLITQNVSVSHNCFIGKFSHLSPGSSLGGEVYIGEHTLVGVGSSISPFVTVGKHVIIAPGSAVWEDIEDFTVVEGVPAKGVGNTGKK